MQYMQHRLPDFTGKCVTGSSHTSSGRCALLLDGLFWAFRGLPNVTVASVVSDANVLFKQTNLLSEWTERDHFMNWFVLFSVQLSSTASMPAGVRVRVSAANPTLLRLTHTENCEDVIHVRAVIRSWFANLLHTENCGWGHDFHSRTVLKVALCHSLAGQGSWFTFSNRTAKISTVLLTSV